ncbi:MAG: haloacid dehalogenase-like hydrolase [Pirellulaceae bacterium]|jgi:phosphoglycolate phosphatase-like HAD superfamily hydrolase|nr:haloacid dehalogenase-like hydrolase [Pirellulaceae bacterium]
MVVLLFDIDGTLIVTGGAGGDALLHAFSELFGVAEPQEVPFSGRTDRGIASNLFRAHAIPDTDANWRQLRSAYLQRLTAYLPQREGKILPGIASLLDRLSARTDCAVGLLTGNARDGARLKLEHYQLYHHFAFGGYGDDHVDRDDVAREALRACRAHLRSEPAPDRVWVIGDTPLDVRCARAVGARVAAVATGWDSREQLAAAQPDLLLDTLEEPDALLAQIG